MQPLVKDTKRYYHQYSETLDNDMTIKEMCLFFFMQFEQDRTDTMKLDIYWDLYISVAKLTNLTEHENQN
jgi:hypothetical protein